MSVQRISQPVMLGSNTYKIPSGHHVPFPLLCLDPYISQKFLESSLMVRAGIPYGKELDDPTLTSDDTRGLLFVSYQSSLDNGFVRQSAGFGGNNFFPTTSVIPQYHGQDPIIAGPPLGTGLTESIKLDSTTMTEDGRIVLSVTKEDTSDKYQITGVAQKVDTSASAVTPEFFVTSRGGEYFFVPSVSTLNQWSG